MNKLTLILMTTSIALGACSNNDNVLMNSSFDTPHGVPPFDKIKYSDYVPAFEKAIAEADDAVKLIVANRNEPTFRNTIVPFDRRREHLSRLTNIFFNLRETDSNDQLNSIAEKLLPMLTEAGDDVYMNAELFARIKAVYDTRRTAGLDSTQIRVVEKYYNDFVRNGALLTDAQQQTLREYNKQLSLLELSFGNNLLEETNNSFRLVVDTVADLAGLPENLIVAAAELAEKQGLRNKWVFTLHKATLIPFLQYCDNHELRKAMYDAYCQRGNNGNKYDNKENVLKITSLRAKRAKLLGYKSHAHYVIAENMAATPEAADSFLRDLWVPSLKKAKTELFDMTQFAYRYNRTTKIEACDWWYWAEKLRKAKYDIEETELSAYFPLDNVRRGLFDVANKLYGVTFREAAQVPHYNAVDNVVYEVYESTGDYLGLVYFDWHPRSSKSGGAWCTMFQEPLDGLDKSRTEAHVSIVCNFTKPSGNAPALLTFDEVQTMFHEFGHALQALFTRGQYRRTAGAVPNDYVEMPSQIMEHWAAEPLVLKSFGRHYQSGEEIPDALIEKLQRAGTFNQGFAMTELIAASLLDLAWHTLPADSVVTDVNAFEESVLSSIGLIPEILPRYRSTYFSHIFDGGYSAGYYVYLWAELLDCDAFAAFTDSGDIFNQDLARNFRTHCLSEVGDGEPMEQYVKFRGQKPDIEHLLKYRGLK